PFKPPLLPKATAAESFPGSGGGNGSSCVSPVAAMMCCRIPSPNSSGSRGFPLPLLLWFCHDGIMRRSTQVGPGCRPIGQCKRYCHVVAHDSVPDYSNKSNYYPSRVSDLRT